MTRTDPVVGGKVSRRSLLFGALAAGAAPLLTACAGAGGDSGSGDGGDGGGEGTLTFLADTRDEWPRLESRQAELKDKYGFGFTMQHLQETPLRAKTGLELTAPSTTIDVLLMDFLLLPQYASNQRLAALDDALADNGTFRRDDFHQPFLDALTVDGKLYGLPITQDCNVLMYRADIFDELGLQAPETMDDLAEVAREIADWGKSKNVSGIAMRGQRGVGISEWTWPCFLHSFGGSYYQDFPDDLNPALDSDEAIAALEFYVQLLADAGPKGAASYGPVEVLDDLSQGRTAMVLDSATLGTTAENPKESKVAGKVGYAMVPEGEAGRHPGFYTWALSAPAKGTQPEHAAEFIGWAVSPDIGTAVGFSAPDQALAKTYDFEPPTVMPSAKGLREVIEKSLEIADPDYRPRNEQAQQVGDIVSVAVSQAVAGSTSPSDALRSANDQIRDVLKKAGLI